MQVNGIFWGRLAIVNAAIAAVITVAFADVTMHTSLRHALDQFLVSFLLTCCISPACVLLMPRITPAVFSRFKFPVNWLIVLAVMGALAAAGSLFGLAILAEIGRIRPDQILTAWLDNSLRVSVIVT